MVKLSSTKHHIFELQALINDDFLVRISESALNFKKDASEPARKKLMQAIKRSVEVKGFRNASLASARQLKQPVAHSCRMSEDLFVAILPVWLEANPELQAAMKALLEEKGIKTFEMDYFKEKKLEGGTRSDLFDIRDEFLEKFKETDEDDAALMVCLVSACFPEMEEEPEEEEIEETE